jgi:hypothetical protein
MALDRMPFETHPEKSCTKDALSVYQAALKGKIIANAPEKFRIEANFPKAIQENPDPSRCDTQISMRIDSPFRFDFVTARSGGKLEEGWAGQYLQITTQLVTPPRTKRLQEGIDHHRGGLLAMGVISHTAAGHKSLNQRLHGVAALLRGLEIGHAGVQQVLHPKPALTGRAASCAAG